MITIGADPEFFLLHEGKFIDPFFIPGSKEEPQELEGGIFIQKDGLAGEFNIPPAKNEDEFVSFMQSAWNQIAKLTAGFEISKSALAEFDPVDWEDINFMSKILGCEPDYDSSGKRKRVSNAIAARPIRSAGGHVHIGWIDGDFPAEFDLETKLRVANNVNNALEVVLSRVEGEDDIKRRKIYGANGAWRPKRYGVECRAPSNKWVFEEKLVRQVYRAAKSATESALAA